ncbi:hypothetical protein J19TS2_11340 [Cohnella xylanilytica]|uniref:DUF2935 domain-containing protein n=1 Tax=Cohnella xylanilytica TaxID=557555 RepID=A0A841TWM1_9BACL|nr:DUF2935 domain-containing protein [Cohnella xylanilytica]MBB6690270.1 DUF2935 domain-containing protein [Cohnella xylanilytica]GIO11579.1 hypothetical protein J19TS2_11340 [Cohnella xylanilytica]
MSLQGHAPSDALFEHRFWLQILGDHARFILNGLSPKETNDIAKAQRFIAGFDRLLRQAREATAATDLTALNQAANAETMALRDFKLDLLSRSLLGKITISLPPTFLNHMLNELEEYGRILTALLAGQPVPIYHPLHHDLLWLQDAYGHAGSIASGLDRVEADLLHRSVEFEKHFQALYLKAVEMAGYLRTRLQDFPPMRRFHEQIDLEMALFRKFLHELEELELKAESLDIISPLMPDHMAREECYYLLKLAQSGAVPSPNCDPTKARVES